MHRDKRKEGNRVSTSKAWHASGMEPWASLVHRKNKLAATGSVSSISELQECLQHLPREEQQAMFSPDHTAALHQPIDVAINMLAGCRVGCHQLLRGQAASVTAGQDHPPPHLILLGWEGVFRDGLRPALGMFEQQSWILQHGVQASHGLLQKLCIGGYIGVAIAKLLQMQALLR